MQIEYTVKPLLGIPVKWVAEITDVRRPYTFTDSQLLGPYKLWEHIHRFHTVASGVKMTDEVKYCLPLSWLGIITHRLFVRNKLKEKFDFRASILKQLFGQLNEHYYVAG